MTGKRKPGAKSPAEIDLELEKAKTVFDRMYAGQEDEQRLWAEEIAMLESRVKHNYRDLELPGGGRIRVRSCLTGPEMERLDDLEKQRIACANGNDAKGMNEAVYQILEIVTANPRLTAEYFRKNPTRYSQIDIITIGLGYYEGQVRDLQERAEKVRRAISFRKNQGGAGIRGLPAEVGVPES